MIQSEAKQLLPVLQACAEGKTIQFKKMDGWWDIDSSEHIHFIDPELYRIKPPEIIENGICDACGKEAQYLQVVNRAPLVSMCRACLERSTELKPCPFCGGEANILNFAAFCTVCDASSGNHETPDECAAAWNKRVT